MMVRSLPIIQNFMNMVKARFKVATKWKVKQIVEIGEEDEVEN